MKLLAFLLSAAVALEVCFDDQSCFDMNTVSLPPQELVDIVLAPNTWNSFTVSTSTDVANAVYGSTDPTVSGHISNETYAIGFATAAYTAAFALQDVNAELRNTDGQGVDAVLFKNRSLAVASALSWHSKRNRAFTDQYGKIVFRAEPNLKVDNCWYDSALSPYEQLHTNVTTWTFMSTSIGLDFPFYWADSQFGSNPVRILVIARNTSNPNSAPYLWPLSTTMQSEVTYAPGQLFMQLGCRRESMRWNSPVLDGGFVNTRVAFTLMYEATTGQQRLDAASELRLEKQLNSSIDAMRDICLPFYCIYGLQGPTQIRAFACKDITTGAVDPVQRQYPHRPVLNAHCEEVLETKFTLWIYDSNADTYDYCLDTRNATTAPVLIGRYCDQSQTQTFDITPVPNNQFQFRLSGTNFCIDGSGQLNDPVVLATCSVSTALTYNYYKIYAAGTLALTYDPASGGVVWGYGHYVSAISVASAQVETGMSIPSALKAHLRKRVEKVKKI